MRDNMEDEVTCPKCGVQVCAHRAERLFERAELFHYERYELGED